MTAARGPPLKANGVRTAAATDAFERLVRQALAGLLAIEPEAIDGGQDLHRDLGLASVDIGFVLLRLEDVAHVEFPNATVSVVLTVRDLTDRFPSIANRRKRGFGCATPRAPPFCPRASAMGGAFGNPHGIR